MPIFFFILDIFTKLTWHFPDQKKMRHAERAPVLQGPLGVSTLAAEVPRSTVRNHGPGWSPF